MFEEEASGEPLALGVMADTGETLGEIDEDSLDDLIRERKRFDEVSREAIDTKSKKHLGTDDSVEDPSDLSQAGWAVLWGAKATPGIRKALEPLLEIRRRKAGKLFAEFGGETGYQAPHDGVPGDSAASWLERKNIELGDVNPRRGVPFYVMIVAPPDDIPFEFQYGLDLFWAVGRLWFDDDDPAVQESMFRRYAESVAEYEKPANKPATARQLTIFAPRNGNDRAMGLLIDTLARPMMQKTEIDDPFGAAAGFRQQAFLENSATADTLETVLRGKAPNGTPAVLFTGSHGMVFLPGDVRQEAEQGAVVCQEWKGEGPPKRSHYFTAKDLPSDARVHGMIHFLFDCYGAGWPRKDTFSRGKKVVRNVAPKASLARLQQALLSHPNGGALAVIGHVDRAWSSSYRTANGAPRIEGFRSVFDRIMAGKCVGYATDRLNLRWATLSIQLAEELELEDFADRKALRNKWVVRDDARNYIVFGDPAVKIRTAEMPELPA